jgi:hypothetical protein
LYVAIAIAAGPLVALLALFGLIAALVLSAVWFVAAIPAFLLVLFVLSIYLQVQAVWYMPGMLSRVARWRTRTRDRMSTAADLPFVWSNTVEAADRQLVHEIRYQLEALSSQTNEFLGLVAFGTAITTAAVLALSGAGQTWAWASLALVAALALVGGYVLSSYTFHPQEPPGISQLVVALTLGLPEPAADDLRLQFFKTRLGDSRTNAEVIDARGRFLLVVRATIGVVVVMLILGLAARAGSAPHKVHKTSGRGSETTDGKAKAR